MSGIFFHVDPYHNGLLFDAVMSFFMCKAQLALACASFPSKPFFWYLGRIRR